MPFRKFATATIIGAEYGTLSGFAKGAHRAVFNYQPKPGFLYVRSRAISSRCNDNFDMFPAEEIEKAYLTFIGKPVFVNHHNEDHRRARGVIIDAALHKDRNPDGSPDTWVEVLHEIDALTYPKLAKAIVAGEVNRTSMGCDVQFSKCSACGNVATSPLEYCAHIPGKKGKRLATGRVAANGKRETQLIFEICSGLSFFENSLLVEPPADPTAYFLGDVEYGSGLEHLAKTASKEAGLFGENYVEMKAFKRGLGHGWEDANAGRPHSAEQRLSESTGYENGSRSTRKKYLHGYDSAYNAINRPGVALDAAFHQRESAWTKIASRTTPNSNSSIWNLIKKAADEEQYANAAAKGEANDHVRSFEGRPVPNHGDRVAVYRDLSGAPKSGYPARGSWSIKRLSERGGRSPHVHAHTVGMHITDASPVFDEGARQHFKETEKRGVHAYIGGNVHHYSHPEDKPVGENPREVSYYPDISKFFMKDTRNPYLGSEHAAFLGGKMYASGKIHEDEEHGPVPQSKFEQPKTGSIWEMIYEADLIGDDLDDLDLWATAAKPPAGVPQNNAERHALLDEKTGNGKGVRNLLDLVHKASASDHELHSGMKWYDDAHGIAKTISEHHRQQEGHIFHGLSSEEALHRTAGTIGVYSSSSAPAPNLHMAMDAIHHGQAVYSKPVKDETGKTVGNSGFNPNGEGHEFDRRGLPMADDKGAAKINGMLHHGKSIDEAWKGGSAHKTHNFAHLIANPNSVDEQGRDRVVVDRHAIAAVLGHKGSSGEVYDNPNGPHFASVLGSKSGYHKVADMYRQAADHINSSDEFKPLREKLHKSGLLEPGERVRAHHVQALTWVQQKKISGSRTTTKDQQEIDRFQGSYTHRYGGGGHKPTNWQGFAGGDDRHDKVALLRRLAYGETKAPQDVDTLRAENCTVCGNSTAFDGVQCQICGYVAPPRPFGDPDTETAANTDLRKQVLDSADGTADPNDPEQQLGNQIGDPDILDEQAESAEAEGTIPALTCTNCATGIMPAPPATSNGEPPYPAEGDVCPVCKKGELAADSNGEAEEEGEDADGDGVPDEEEDPDALGEPEPGDDPDEDDDTDDEEEDPKITKKDKDKK